MSDTKVGVLPPEFAQRDAIHIAVAPVVSDGTYPPGKHVGFMPDGTVGADAEHKIGIVDPFLNTDVEKGERFWLFLYPQTVTGMRHHWSHPAFTPKTDLEESERWLRAYALELKPYDSGEKAYRKFVTELERGELFGHGKDMHSFSDVKSPELLKYHAERALGIHINWEQFTFSCSC